MITWKNPSYPIGSMYVYGVYMLTYIDGIFMVNVTPLIYHTYMDPSWVYIQKKDQIPYEIPSGWWFEPLWKIWKSIGMMTFPIYGKIENGNQTTNQPWFFLDSPSPQVICQATSRVRRVIPVLQLFVQASGGSGVKRRCPWKRPRKP